MRKKIIFLAVCAVLLLIFMSSSYGELDPKYVLLAHPWEEMNLCAAPDSMVITFDKAIQNNNIGILVIRIIGTDIVLATHLNSITCAKSTVHKPTILREK